MIGSSKKCGQNAMLKAVIDTNLLVRGLLKGKTILPLIEALKNNQFQLITSYALIAELTEVLKRERLKIYFTLDDLKELLDLIEAQGQIVKVTQAIKECRDPKDDIVLECAVEGKADCIVTGDQDLLTLSPFRGIKIVSPQEFLKNL